MDGDGGNQLRLTDDPAWDDNPSWSPDGERIAFVSNRDSGYRRIYVMHSDGSNLMKLTKESSNLDPAWSPDGTRIAFTRFKGLNKQVWVMDPDGGNQIQLTQVGRNYNPAWSPDGVRIAFVSSGRHAGPEIYAMDENGENQQRLTVDLADKSYPSWSPDGQWIAYDSIHRGVFQIVVVRTDGSGLKKRLTRNLPNKMRPAWSPDGNTIAYASGNPFIRSSINLMTPDGDHLKQLTEGENRADTDPDWYSPIAWSVSPAANFITMWGEIKEPKSARR
jgi:Tol biopolymer transport system component